MNDLILALEGSMKIAITVALEWSWRHPGAANGNRRSWVLTCWERARQRRALAALDDHLLQDVGISRAEAIREIHRPFWRS
jgi:uncharacterized protein YjiS (DUF1127 family)